MPLYIRDRIVLLKVKGLVGFLLSDCLWNRDCSVWKLLSSTLKKTGHLFQSHTNSSPRLHHNHAPLQHLDANCVNSYDYEHLYPTTLLRSTSFEFIWIAFHHVGSRWVHGKDSNSSPRINIYNAIADMAFSRLVSGCLQRLQGCNNCPPFTPFTCFIW
jgi:hypothetical protein